MSVFHNNALIGSGAGAAADTAAAGPIKSLRFNSGDSAYLSRTPSTASNRRTFTYSCWVKRTTVSSGSPRLFGTYDSSFIGWNIEINTSDKLEVHYSPNGSSYPFRRTTTQVFRDPSAWYHIVVAVDTSASTADDRIKLYVNGSQITTFDNDANGSQNTDTNINTATAHRIGLNYTYSDFYLADVYFIDGSALDPTSFGAFDDNGVWQAAAYSGTFGTNGFHLLDFANESTVGHDSSGNDNDFTANNITSSLSSGNTGPWTSGFRDGASPGGSWGSASATNVSSGDSWSTNANQDELHINTGDLGGAWNLVLTKTGGSNEMDVFTSSTGSSGWTRLTNSSSSITISSGTSSHAFLQYVRIGGSGGGHVTFSITGTAFGDAASALDVLFDVPVNGTQSDTGAGGEVSGNYMTINPLSVPGQSVTVSNGNLDAAGAGTNVARTGTIAVPSSGKWYWEVTCNSGGSGLWLLGINGDSSSQAKRLVYVSDARKYTDTGGGFSSYGASFTTGDVIGVAVDMDADTLTFYKNGSSQGTAFTSISSGYTNIFPYFQTEQSGRSYSLNAGQRAFAYSAPSNHKALCTTNLPTPTIADGSDYFEAKTYTGNGSTQSITGFEFSPDWVWYKDRGSTNGHALFDSVRGAQKRLRTMTTAAEVTDSTYLTSFNSDGFTVGSHVTGNASGSSYIAWCWDAGSSTVSNTDGSITSSVRANQTAGFSIVGWSSSSSVSTVGHGLGAEPHVIFTKNRSVSNAWWTYFKGIGNTKVLRLDDTNAESTMSSTWNDTTPTSSVFTVGGEWGSGNNIIAYCFAPVEGYSSIGTFVGNGSSDGVFVYTGHRSRFIMLKRTDDARHWWIFDTARSEFNAVDKRLRADTNNAENTGDILDINSNGFKLRSGNSEYNASTGEFMYMSFAENPFQANGGLAR